MATRVVVVVVVLLSLATVNSSTVVAIRRCSARVSQRTLITLLAADVALFLLASRVLSGQGFVQPLGFTLHVKLAQKCDPNPSAVFDSTCTQIKRLVRNNLTIIYCSVTLQPLLCFLCSIKAKSELGDGSKRLKP